MTPGKFDLGDYVQVDERIAQFRLAYPGGSLQSEVILWPSQELSFVGVKAWAYRTADDERPGIGLAWEPFPGKTPYTRESELQNAETSAWGRAIVAVLAADTRKGIATAEDVRNRQASGEPSTQPTQGVPPPSSSVPAERQSPDPSKYQGTPTQPSGDEAQRDTGAPTHGEGTSPETVQESGGHVNGEVAVTPAPGAVIELGAEGAKALAAALGGQKFALDLARDEYGEDVTSLRKLTMAQGAKLLEIKGVSA